MSRLATPTAKILLPLALAWAGIADAQTPPDRSPAGQFQFSASEPAARTNAIRMGYVIPGLAQDDSATLLERRFELSGEVQRDLLPRMSASALLGSREHWSATFRYDEDHSGAGGSTLTSSLFFGGQLTRPGFDWGLAEPQDTDLSSLVSGPFLPQRWSSQVGGGFGLTLSRSFGAGLTGFLSGSALVGDRRTGLSGANSFFQALSPRLHTAAGAGARLDYQMGPSIRLGIGGSAVSSGIAPKLLDRAGSFAAGASDSSGKGGYAVTARFTLGWN